MAIMTLVVFYGCYFVKMFSQKKKGIQTDQIGKGKHGIVKVIETMMKIVTILMPIAEVVSIALNKSVFPTGVRIIGVIVGIIGTIIFICAVLHMKDSWRAGVSETDKTSLVTRGIYQISRNPAFLGFDLVYLGILLQFFHWWLFALSVVAILLFHLQITNVEEDFLIVTFGEEYINYKNQVNRYIGRKASRKQIRNTILLICSILAAAIIAILVHALLPSPGGEMNVEDFNSLLVQTFGFPVVASSYFILLYLHIVIVLVFYGKRTEIQEKRINIGLRFGCAFALLYFVGMQEVVVSSSPFTEWGFDFVIYQFFMGLGDAIPALLLCIATALLFLPKNFGKVVKAGNESNQIKSNQIKSNQTESYDIESKQAHSQKLNTYVIRVLLIALAFFAERTIGYYIGYIDSDIESYPVPVLVWTALFGIILGVAVQLITPICVAQNKTRFCVNVGLVIIGLNWIIFNSFIGMIMAGTIGIMLLRSGIDVIILVAVLMSFNCRKTTR